MNDEQNPSILVRLLSVGFFLVFALAALAWFILSMSELISACFCCSINLPIFCVALTLSKCLKSSIMPPIISEANLTTLTMEVRMKLPIALPVLISIAVSD